VTQALQPWQVFLAALAGWVNRHQQTAIDFLREENRVFLEQLGKRRIRFTDGQRRRLAVAGKAVGRRALLDLAGLVTPDTILAWHRKLVAAKGDALANLGHHVARTTVANILARNGVDPAPERGSRMSWRTFLGAHWSTIAAIDFTTVEAWGRHGLVTTYVLFAIELRGRRVQFAGVTPNPNDDWIRQMERILTDPVDGFLREKRFCLMDRDAKFTTAFRTLLAEAGIEPVRLPPSSITSECLDRMIFFGEDSLRRAVREYLAHYHAERNHQGLGNAIVAPLPRPTKAFGRVRCRERLGGMLRYDRRDAA